jgi:hypothetical protein
MTLVVLARGGPLPLVKIGGNAVTAAQSNRGSGWMLAEFELSHGAHVEVGSSSADLFETGSGEVSVWLKPNGTPNFATTEILPPTHLKTPALLHHALSADQLKTITAAKLRIDLFGSDGGAYANKRVLCNGEPILTLPANKHGDTWEDFVLDIQKESLGPIALANALRVTNPSKDKFKLRNVALAVQLADGSWVSTPPNTGVHCHDKEWAHFEGTAFENDGSSARIEVNFESGK